VGIHYRHGGGSEVSGSMAGPLGTASELPLTAPATEAAARWDGWGTALKPGQEMWWLARKPLKGTVAASVLEFGTGALNIAACMVGTSERLDGGAHARNGSERHDGAEHWRYKIGGAGEYQQPPGRWPANVVFTHSAACDGRCAPDCPAGELDRQSGVLTSGAGAVKRASAKGGTRSASIGAESRPEGTPVLCHGDTGGASRFYPVFRYQAKAPASERPRLDDGTAHETVKPLGLMTWLVRLITPPGGTVLDLFAGSGPVAEACIIEGFRCVLIEQDPKSAALIRKRLGKPIQPVMFAG
jgi:site-specific DNA-methyltransferase (adenine-specific)